MRIASAQILSALLSLSAAFSAFAGSEISESHNPVSKPEAVRTILPDDPVGLLTAGVQFSEHATGAFIDSITGLWTTEQRDAFLFLDSLYHYQDDGQFVSSTGLAFRKLFPDRKVILGVNVFWDAINSARDNDFNQFGIGVELLTQWVDFRFNYYLPENEQYEFGREERVSGRTRIRDFSRYEAPLEGCDAELGFLLPGLSRRCEVRLFGGYYRYNNPFGGDFTGFKARLEARPFPGLMIDLEYWDDAALMGGHWIAGMRVSVPLSLYNIIKGRNPFEGTAEYFTTRTRNFDERLGEMIIRSQRIKTKTSNPILTAERNSN